MHYAVHELLLELWYFAGHLQIRTRYQAAYSSFVSHYYCQVERKRWWIGG